MNTINNDKNTINKYYDELNILNEIDHINEYIMLGLRKTKGINIDEFNKTFNKDFEEVFNDKISKYQNLLLKNGSYYYLNDEGLNVSNTILSDFLL